MLLQLGIEILGNIQNHLTKIVNFEISNSVASNVNQKLIKVCMEEYEDTNAHDLIERVLNKIATGVTNVLNSFLSILSPFFMTITHAAILYAIVWYFPIIIILSNIPYIISLFLNNRKRYNQYVERNKDKRYIQYLTNALMERQNAKDIRLYKLVDFFTEKLNIIRTRVFKSELNLSIRLSHVTLLMDFIKNLSLGICLVLTAILVWRGETTIGSFVMVYSVVNQITANLSSFMNQISNMDDIGIYLKDWGDLLELTEESKSNKKCENNFSVRFQNVSFHYPNVEKNVLDNISIEINHGDKVAIVGENGSGKSTFLNLLLGLYRPTSGDIFISNDKIEDVLTDYRKKSVCMFQDYIKFQLSIAENVMAGNFGQDISLDSHPHLLDTIPVNLSNGLDTELGQLDENAVELSGGEWQKIALVRTLIRENSEMIILDEPTSNLDPIIECGMIEMFRQFYNDKKFIITSHRFVFSNFCNRIIVFDKGKIVEDGSHHELMENKGVYYELYRSQNKLFMDSATKY